MIVQPSLLEQAALSTLLSQPHRYYHNINHINDMLVEMDKYFNISAQVADHQREILTYSIWYHDAIYNPYAPPGWNEQHSCELFTDGVHHFGELSDVVSINVKHAILASAHHMSHQTVNDIVGVFLDIDLSGFGQSYEIFQYHTNMIRKEYFHTSDFEFLKGRLKFLKAIYQRNSLYYSEYFRTLYHQKSQDNIAIEIEHIEHELS